MSWSKHQFKEYGELSEYDSLPVSDDVGSSAGSPPLATRTTEPSTPATNHRLSEFSMDLNDLGEFQEDARTNRCVSGSMHSKNKTRAARTSMGINELQDYQDALRATEDASNNVYGLSDGSCSSWYQQPSCPQNNIGSEEDDDDDNDALSGYLSYRTYANNRTQARFDEVSECSLSIVEENEGTESSMSLGSKGSTNSSSRRRVKFEISSRLEHIREFEKPDIEDRHLLYYSVHELQKQIDEHRAQERNAVRWCQHASIGHFRVPRNVSISCDN